MLKDEEARKKIADQLDTNILVEAGAGSGKTASLVKRMVNLIISGRCRVEEMAAITFTRKAAAELRERFQDKLEDSYRNTHNPQTSRILDEALLNLDRCFVGTIHSFCTSLLRERPVEAGIDPGFEELDDLQKAVLMDQAWQEYLLFIRANRPALLEQVEGLNISLEDLKGFFLKFSPYPEVDIAADNVSAPCFSDALQALNLQVRKALRYIPDPPHENRYDDLQKKILSAGRMLNNLDINQHTNAVRLLSLFEKIPKTTLKLWTDKEESKIIRADFEQFSINWAAPLLRAWREYCYYHVTNILLPARDYLAAFKDRHSALDFHDLLMKTATMLRESPEVRSYYKSKYRCLLVDEFQDTDPLQSEIMFCLTGKDIYQKNWQKLVPQPGSLFVVGDPKQSIYRFRRADIDIYNHVKKLIKDSGGEVLFLTTNFRCLKPLEDFTNRIFEKLLAHEENRYQALYSPVDAFREGDTHSGIQLLQVDAAYTKKEEIIQEDARQVALFIRHALNGAISLARSSDEKAAGLTEKPVPGDFMIILSYKDMMETYARALEELGVPVTMTGGSSLSESLELAELMKLLKYLNDPQNTVLLVAVLKGLLFGISDNELYHFKINGGRFNPMAPLPDGLDENNKQIFTDAFNRLSIYLKWKRSLPASVVLANIIENLGLVPFALTRPLGERNCSYLYQITEYIRQGKVFGSDPFRQMVEQLEQLVETGTEEELELDISGKDNVRLMNLHKAKGLEAPVVILANPYKRVENSEDRIDNHIIRTGANPVGYFSFYREGRYQNTKLAQPPGWDNYATEELKFLQAEKIRLLYVAATRARNLLVISTSEKDTKMSKNPWKELLENYDANLETLFLPELTAPQEQISGRPVNLDELLTMRDKNNQWLLETACSAWHKIVPSKMKNKNGWKEAFYAQQEGWDDESVVIGKVEQKDAAELLEDMPGGAKWGIVMHNSLEALVKEDPELQETIRAELEAGGFSLNHLSDVLLELESFKTTTLWEEIQAAGKNKHTEVPFSLIIKEGHHLYEMLKTDINNHKSILVKGSIDLVYLDKQGWVIVDYKTDQVSEEEQLKQLLRQYSPQIHLYVHAWQDLTGEKVARGEIFFFHLKRSYRVYP